MGDTGKHNPAKDIRWHEGAIDAATRAQSCGQRGCTVWMTGISGSGKSTMAVLLEQHLIGQGRLALRLDGDNLRLGLNQGLGFDAAGRAEAVRRAGEAALLLSEAGIVAIVCMISPYAVDRARVRERHRVAKLPFMEVLVDCPLSVARERDPKGLYRRADAGEIPSMTGVSDPYEPPETPEVHLHTDIDSPAACLQTVLARLTSPA